METTLVKADIPLDEFKANYFGIEWIETEKLFIDPNYQRQARLALIKSIKEAWDWRAVRTLAVSLREDDTFAVIDGQQRLMAARECNIVKLPCQIYIDLNEKQEAELFLKLNNSNKPSTNDMFRAKLAEGDAEAKLIAMAVNNTGWQLDLASSAKGAAGGIQYAATAIVSVQTLMEIYQQNGIIHLQSVLNMCHGWYGQHLAASADMMKGTSDFLKRFKTKIDMSRLTEKLSEHTPSSIIGNAGQLVAAQRAAGSSISIARHRAITEVIKGIYNKGLRPSNRLEG